MIPNNEKGFTLIEAMIALIILAALMLGSTTAIVAMKNRGVENLIKKEAVKLGTDLVNNVRNELYSSIATGPVFVHPDSPIVRNVGGFDVAFNVTQLNAVVQANTAKSAIFTITWTSASSSNTKEYVARTLVGRK